MTDKENTFEEEAKKAGEELTKRILSEEFEYCMGYIAMTDSDGKFRLDLKLPLLEIKILESGLEEYEKSLHMALEGEIKNGDVAEFSIQYKSELEACDKILVKLKTLQVPLFAQLSWKDIAEMYHHKILGSCTWTGGGTIQ